MKNWWEKYVSTVPGAGVFFPEENWLPLSSATGLRLMTYRFHIDNPRALLFCFHGAFGQSNEASLIGQRFSQAGFEVLAMDQESHGKSEGAKGRIISFHQFREDAITYIFKAKNQYPRDLPIFLLGYSMGGAISIMVASAEPKIIKGVILFAPALGVNPNYHTLLVKMTRCANLCFGCVRIIKWEPEILSRNEDVLRYWNENPHNYKGRLPVKSGAAMLDLMRYARSLANNFTVPVVLVQGTIDNIISEKQNQKFIERCKSQDKDIWTFDGMYHFIGIEPEIIDIIPKCIEWVEARID
jgi:acylglycerol lipase